MNDEDKADSLNYYFASVSSLDDSQADLPPFVELTDNSLDTIEITEEEINDVLENLDPNKASGPDMISNKMVSNYPLRNSDNLTNLHTRTETSR